MRRAARPGSLPPGRAHPPYQPLIPPHHRPSQSRAGPAITGVVPVETGEKAALSATPHHRGNAMTTITHLRAGQGWTIDPEG